MAVHPQFLQSAGTARTGIFSNLAFFQAGWTACVLGAVAGHPWSGIFLALLIAVAHIVQAARPGGELRLVATTTLLGALWNSALQDAGLVIFAGDDSAEWLAPTWTLALAMLSATTLNVALRRLRHQPWLGALLGATAVPLAYLAGGGLGAITLPYPEIAVGILGLGGMALLPLLLRLARHCDDTPLPLPAKLG
ncbi:Protein of unknown function [Methylomagnum ishizawai]|uniref:DUF2878 domain-containing protein n=1 Tax=Methylomagnum ishizawai TaxID=1760988 RepID=A0A1Y6CZJ1_9GAMM|nr:DUF2878 domain-containing protein [Methylomagnum ishizawai]SMF95761.1 Protein of unknown function [Methylomagnum ishizawai]